MIYLHQALSSDRNSFVQLEALRNISHVNNVCRENEHFSISKQRSLNRLGWDGKGVESDHEESRRQARYFRNASCPTLT